MLPLNRIWKRTICGGIVCFVALFGDVAATEPKVREIYLDILESTVDDYEPLWTDFSDTVPDSGYFNFAEYSN